MYADFDKQLMGSFSSSLMWADRVRTNQQQYKIVIVDDDADVSLPQRLIVIQSKVVSFLVIWAAYTTSNPRQSSGHDITTVRIIQVYIITNILLMACVLRFGTNDTVCVIEDTDVIPRTHRPGMKTTHWSLYYQKYGCVYDGLAKSGVSRLV